jgi:hypothetical protein
MSGPGTPEVPAAGHPGHPADPVLGVPRANRERSCTRCMPPRFPGGPGKTTDPKDFTSLMDDLEERIFGVLPDETWVYPGHGDDTTLGAERPHVGEWRARGW